MQELAIFVSQPKYLSYVDTPFTPPQRQRNMFTMWQENIMAKVAAHLDGQSFSRLYFGQEFCERLLPTRQELEQALTFARQRGMDFTLVTPYVTDAGIEKVRQLFNYLQEQGQVGEVVFNDWGVLLLLLDEFPEMEPVAGRVIDKMKRDPRFTGRDYEEFFSREGRKMLMTSNITAPPYRQLLCHYGVHRVELDPVLQGFDFDLRPVGLKASVYLPYGFATTGRICFIGSLNQKAEDKFTVIGKCRRECQAYDQYLQKNISPIPEAVTDGRVAEIELERKGNTVFFANIDVASLLKNENFDRLIYQPRVPI
jgi:hypothetical protein